MNWTLEVVVVPVSDVDRAKAFYADAARLQRRPRHRDRRGHAHRPAHPARLGLLDRDRRGRRAGHAAGLAQGAAARRARPRGARAELLARGVDPGEVQVVGENPTPQPDPLDNVGFLFFSDPDGNGWAVQQISARASA